MTADVKSLFGDPLPTLKPDNELISVLEEWLEAAKSGEIVAFHGIVTYRDSGVVQIGTGHYDKYRLIGALSCLKASIISG